MDKTVTIAFSRTRAILLALFIALFIIGISLVEAEGALRWIGGLIAGIGYVPFAFWLCYHDIQRK